MKKQILSFITLGIFLLLAAGSAVNKFSSFSFGPTTQESKSGEYYVELMNGQRIETDEMKIKGGIITKSVFKADGVTYPLTEVKAYMEDGTYHLRVGKHFAKRIIHGKINVYEQTYLTHEYDNHTKMPKAVMATRYFYQKADTGELIKMPGQKEVIEAVADCPVALEMADISVGKFNKARRRNRQYLNSIFETYNNDCMPLTTGK